jgi:hypothetical protein
VWFQQGITIVDTPGIGESQAMEDLVTDFIAKNQVHGFVFVIKTDNAGGVQGDRVRVGGGGTGG